MTESFPLCNPALCRLVSALFLYHSLCKEAMQIDVSFTKGVFYVTRRSLLHLDFSLSGG
jgi:hypothetical protein